MTDRRQQLTMHDPARKHRHETEPANRQPIGQLQSVTSEYTSKHTTRHRSPIICCCRCLARASASDAERPVLLVVSRVQCRSAAQMNIESPVVFGPRPLVIGA